MPESIRWLISKNRYDEARNLILQAAKMNGKTVPGHLLKTPSMIEREQQLNQVNMSFRRLKVKPK